MDADGRTAIRLDIEPEAGDEERAAVEQALARVGVATAAAGRSAWWRAGARESVEDVTGERPL